MSRECGVGVGANLLASGACPTVGSQEVTVSVPVAIRAFAEVGDIRTTCMGPAVITPGTDRVCGTADAVYRFTISQRIKVDVPVVFGCQTDVGQAVSDFGPLTGVDPVSGGCGCR